MKQFPISPFSISDHDWKYYKSLFNITLCCRAADSKKKKSTFRITSIIDPVKNDDEDEDKTEDTEENEGY